MKTKAFLLALSPLFVFSLFSLPEGGQISGNGQIMLDGQCLQVLTQDQRSIIDWNSFSVDLGEIVKFQQPAINSAVLNRVTGSQMSQLLGLLESNGQVFLINPNGVIIGKDAQINTAGFFASTHPVGDFLQEGDLLFQGDSTASIVHLGNISAPDGNIALIAHKVIVEGDISATGTVSLVSGHEVLLKTSGDTLLHIRPDLKGEGIENHGNIEALQTLIQTDGAHTLGINQTGFIRAMKLENVGGKILLKADSSTLNVSGKLEGETIHLLGEQVHLENEAFIDASSAFGGGEILVGGDFQGNNPDILNAQQTFVGANVQLKADATENGDGGKIIVWSDGSTFAYGDISTRGGDEGGNGGFVEVSGKHLNFTGQVNTGAKLGETGSLLLDPTNITISTGGNSGGSFSGCISNLNTFTPDVAATDVINTTTLVGLLNAPCNVTITTASAGAAVGTITISNPIGDGVSSPLWTAATTLTLIANSNIAVNALINNTSASTGFTAISMTANQSATAAGSVTGINIATGGLTTVGGNITLNGTGGSTSGTGVNVTNSVVISSSSGNISLTGTAGPNSFGCILTSSAQISTTSGNITMVGTGGTGTGGVGTYVGSAAATQLSTTSGNISITGQGGLGTANSNYGIYMPGGGGLIQSGTNASLTMIGIGGGSAASSRNNYGIEFGGGTINLANGGTLTLTGVGGGVAGLATFGNHGMRFESSGTSFTFGTGSNVIFQNCSGGFGTGGNNTAIVFSKSFISTTAPFTFNNITGGTGGSANLGVSISSTVSAPTITMTNVVGGNCDALATGSPGPGGNYGLQVNGGATLGSTTTSSIYVSATGGSRQSPTQNVNCTAIQISGNIVAGNSATVTLIGNGGGNNQPTGLGGTSYGVYFHSGTLTVGNVNDVSPSTITITGMGGAGSGGTNYGVIMDKNTTGSVIQMLSPTGTISISGTQNSASTYGIYLTDTGTSIIGTNGNVSLQNPSSSFFIGNAATVTAQNGNITTIADINIVSTGGGTIQTTGRGNIALVVDNAFPSSPNIGPGIFNITGLSLLTNGGMLQLYGGLLNTGIFPVTLNGAAYAQQPYQEDGIYYPEGIYSSGAPYFIYYKTGVSTALGLFYYEMAMSEAFQDWTYVWYGVGYLSNDFFCPTLTPKGLNRTIPSLVQF